MRIVILRLSKKQSPFKPDKSHIHHAIMRLGMTHAKTTLILGMIQIIFITLSVMVNGFSDFEVLAGVILLSLILSVTLDRMIINRLSTKENEQIRE